MCENVNINVSETNETINIVATEVQEVIDINVFETAEDVTLNITEQLIQVNVNKVTAAEQIQSDWAQTDNEALDFIKNKPTIPANTSDLINDGEDGVNPFITANDIPPVTGFVPYTGATEDVNLGEFGLLTGNVEFDNTPTNIPTTAGAMYWNDADGTADLILKGGNVKLQIGQESVIRVVNKTATNINLLEANYQAVRVTGAQGQRLKVDLAQATNDNLSAETIGLVTETINNNQEGFITTSGLVRNINTTGSLQGETWADGDILYLSPTTAGNVTKVKPTAPNHLVIIGYVVHAHANQGSIFVKVDNGYELDELHNVKITSAANNNVLAYTSATDIWENKTVETALGYTPENVENKSTSTSLGTSDTLYPTQNAVKVYADTKFTLPSLTSGSVLFSNGTTIAQDNANLFWDDTNNRLGIGTATPAKKLDVVGSIRTNDQIESSKVLNSVIMSNAPADASLLLYAPTTANYYGGIIGWAEGNIAASISAYDNGSGGALGLCLSTGNNTSISERMRITSAGNVLINTTTDGGFRLDVNGTARVSGTLSFVNASSLNESGTVASDSRLIIRGGQSGAVGSISLITLTTNANITSTFGNPVLVGITRDFAPTSGTATYAFASITGAINQTGGANGITRGLYINPTLTSAADFRAIENSVGKVCLNTTSGNTMIGTTTDAGYKLDVNGTARVSGNTTITPAALTGTAATSALDIAQTWNTTGTPIALKVNITDTASSAQSDLINLQVGGATRFRVVKTGFFSFNTGGDILGNLCVGGSAINSSSQLEVRSTTKGFLPPRMTTTQKNAIATPAAGLVVYDTTLNKLCVYTTAWETITSL